MDWSASAVGAGRQFSALPGELFGQALHHVGAQALVVDPEPIGWKPGRRILVSDNNEELQAKLFSLLNQVIRLAPIILAGTNLHLPPGQLRAHGVGPQFLDLQQIIIHLLEGLIGPHGWIPDLIGHAARNEIIAGDRVPEITVPHLEEALGGLAGAGQHPESKRQGRRRPEEGRPRACAANGPGGSPLNSPVRG